MNRNFKIQDNGDWRNPISFTSWIPLHPPPGKICTMQQRIEASLTKYKDQIINFCDETGIIHSCRIVVTPEVKQENYDLGLLINLIHDKTEDLVVEKLCAILVKVLGEFLQTYTQQGLIALIYRYQLPHKTLFLANIHRTVKEIKQEQQLYQFLQQELDILLPKEGLLKNDVEAIRSALQQKVVASELELPRQPSVELSVKTRKRRRLDLIRTFCNPLIVGLSEDINETIARLKGFKRNLAKVFFLLYKVLAYLVAIPFGIIVLLTEYLEKDVDTGGPSLAKLDRIEDSEDRSPMNSVALFFPIKYSWIRRNIINGVLSQAEKGCRHFWIAGKLVEIDTLHFARIFLTPSRKTMIFMSDYDGGLDRYLDDFLGVGQRAVVAISANVHGCPPTTMFKPRDISVFRGRWRLLIRRHQQLDAFWYSAYPDLEVDQIRNHHFVREGLFANTLSPDELASWIRKL